MGFVVIILCVSILLQPFRLVFADTEESLVDAVIAESLPDIAVSELTGGVDGSEGSVSAPVVAESQTSDGNTPAPSSQLSSTTDVATFEVVSEGDSTSTPFVATAASTAGDNSPAIDIISATSTAAQDLDSINVDPSLTTSTATSATTTTVIADVPLADPELPLVINSFNDNELRFTKDQCTAVADGSFYCQPQQTEKSLDEGLVAAPDADGDLEIYLVRDGTYNQITNNQVDDASPYFDAVSNSIVWHRLIGDRYQIFSYDISTGTEEPITTSGVHDMEPTRQGKYTVWQRWVGEYWQIMLSDGKTEMQLSLSDTHNISPFIRGQFIIWNTKGSAGEQQVQTFDLLTKSYLTIADGDEATMMNPRMMMVYEAVYKNGDIVTRGFDILTGKVTPISALPRNVPDKIPDTDSTGETRALINNKSQGKDVDIESEPEPTPTIAPPLPPLGAVDDFGTTTLDLRPHASTTLPSNLEQQSVAEAAYDLVIVATSTQITATDS